MAYNIFMYKSSLTDEQRKALAFSYGFISRNTDGVINYCLGSGVELQKFPEQFRQTYADEITKVNDWLERMKFLNPAWKLLYRRTRKCCMRF